MAIASVYKEKIVFHKILTKLKIVAGLHLRRLHRFEICITTKCSLRCRDCSNLNYEYYGADSTVKPMDGNVSEIIKHCELLIDGINGVETVKVLGGEPFLHQKMYKLVNYLTSQNKIGKIEITTNGTVLPSSENLSCLKNDKVHILISNYRNLSRKINELENVFRSNSISYQIYSFINDFWVSPGPIKKHNRSIKQLKSIWRSCLAKNCKHVLNGAVYGCPRIAHAHALGIYSPLPSEYILLTDAHHKRLLKTVKALFSRRYFPFCDYCNGLGKYGEKVTPAIQLSGKK